MNEQQNTNTSPKPKKKRSFWWLKLLLILILLAAGVIGGIMLSSQEITQKILGEFFPQLAVSSVEAPAPVETLAPDAVEKPIEFATPTPAPKPSKAPLEIVSPEAKEKAEAEESEKPEETVLPEATAKPEEDEDAAIETPAPEESPAMELMPAFAPSEEVAEAVETDKTELIGIDAALAAALDHAKLDESTVLVYGVSREKNDGEYYYVVEFLQGNREYVYEINAYSAVVESWKILRDRQGAGYGPANGMGNGVAQANASESGEETAYISLEEAKEAALSHAGYKEHETTDMKAELDIEKNKVVYDIEFWAEGYDYDYKVCAVTGLVLTVEKDRG